MLRTRRVAAHAARARACRSADFRAEIQSARELLVKASLTKAEDQEAVCDALESMEQVLEKREEDRGRRGTASVSWQASVSWRAASPVSGGRACERARMHAGTQDT